MDWEDIKKNIPKLIFIGFVVLLGLFILLSLFRIGIIFWLYSSINNWTTIRLGLDEDAAQWLTIVLVCLTTFFFPSLALHSLLFGQDKFRNIALIIGGQTLIFLLVSTVGKEICFDLRTGEELCWYVDTPEGRKFRRRDPVNPKPCFDPKYGIPCRPYTRAMANAAVTLRGSVPLGAPLSPVPSQVQTSTAGPLPAPRIVQDEQSTWRQASLDVNSPIGVIRSYYEDLQRRDTTAVIGKWTQAPSGLREMVQRVAAVQIYTLKPVRQDTSSSTVEIDVMTQDVNKKSRRWSGNIELEQVNSVWKIAQMKLHEKK